MDESKKIKWEIYVIASLILPMPYYVGMAAGTMPLLAYYLGAIYSLITFDPDGIFYAIFLVINTFLLNFICMFIVKLLGFITGPKIKHAIILIVFLGAAFIPWHWSLGVNRPKSFNTFQYYSYVFKAFNKSLQPIAEDVAD